MSKLTGFQNTLKLLLLLLGLVALLSSLTISSADKKGNETKGRYYFRQTCKTCHTKGAVGGEITPLSKSQAQWRAYFTKGTHKKGSEPLSKVMGADQIQDVSFFLVAHAADSLQPETCGK